ncbi:MAG: HAD family phosphatase [Candidatus Kerfeldbacteria bacterium]|nr:HAD family phosphatase [Candidatus Kerfeldbacteria bacterium]
MIKIVFFDMGGVVIRETEPDIFTQIADQLHIDRQAVMKLRQDWKDQLHRGELTAEEFAKKLAELFGVTDDVLAVWRQIYGTNIAPDNGVLAIIRTLRKQYHVGLISNITDIHAGELMKRSLYDLFDPAILSCDVGLSKPGPEIFRLALDRANVNADEAVFIDDVQANVNAAVEVGMKGIRFLSASQLVEDLKNVGVEVHA